MALRESPVGRVEILDRIRAALTDHSGSVLLTGPAGIGKSTVLAAYAAAAGTEALVLRAAAAEVESGLPYLTLVDLLDGVGDQEMA
ncbi:MAG: AAA family ATPase, partial [Micromonosporaceae bacterium]